MSNNKSILKERNDLLNEYCIGKMTNNDFFERLDKIQEQREKELYLLGFEDGYIRQNEKWTKEQAELRYNDVVKPYYQELNQNKDE